MKEVVSISLSKEVVREIDKRRGLVPRSAFIEDLLREILKMKEVPIG